ncbi:hypothetical protein B0H12DRAFT_1233025 [Mycena haematopus]|nr:hypothetical protein B0H12DRAFT_1233025 [Mycena haematopus]
MSPPPPPPPPPPLCVPPCVADNDPRIHYSTSWILSPHGSFQTSHQTEAVGSSLSFNFSGSGISVFGSVPASNGTFHPPTAAYSIDAAAPVVTTEPLATVLVGNQPLFSTSGLANGTHSLAIEVLNVSSAAPFSVDYFIVHSVLPSTTSSPPGSTKSLEKGTDKSSSRRTMGILAGVLGAVVFILICVTAFFIVTMRRRRRRALRSKDLQSKYLPSISSIIIDLPPDTRFAVYHARIDSHVFA